MYKYIPYKRVKLKNSAQIISEFLKVQYKSNFSSFFKLVTSNFQQTFFELWEKLFITTFQFLPNKNFMIKKSKLIDILFTKYKKKVYYKFQKKYFLFSTVGLFIIKLRLNCKSLRKTANTLRKKYLIVKYIFFAFLTSLFQNDAFEISDFVPLYPKTNLCYKKKWKSTGSKV